jgi:hypothetical protein
MAAIDKPWAGVERGGMIKFILPLLPALLVLASFAQESPDPLRKGIDRATGFLLAPITEEQTWVFPPARTRKTIGQESVTVRYREDIVEVPVYEMIDKEILVRRKTDTGDTIGGLEKRIIQVRGAQTGVKQEKRLRKDPNGLIVRQENRPIHGPGGPDEWRIQALGNNAMAGVALLRAGHADADKVVAPMLDFTLALLEEHGLPDQTWDLAWLLILYAESDREAARSKVPEMLAKLMAGQIRSGPAAGLWGPVAVNPDILAGHWRAFWQASETLRLLREKPKPDERRIGEAADAVKAAQRGIDAYTWNYRAPDAHSTWIQMTDEMSGETFRVRRSPDYVFNQVSADLASTWLALYAIRVGRERGLLPAQLPSAPALPAGGPGRAAAPILPPPTPRQILMDAANALARVQDASGAFHETNLHQPVRAFDDLPAIPGVPIADTAFPELPSPVTLTATAQGYSAFVQIGRILGMGELRAYAPRMVRAKQLLDAQLDRALTDPAAPLGGAGLGLTGFALALLDPGPDIATAPRALRSDTVARLLKTQFPNGCWLPLRPQEPPIPTVTLQRLIALPSVPLDFRAFDFARPFVAFPVSEKDENNRAWRVDRFGNAQPHLATAAALLVLAEEARGTEVMAGE